MTPTTNYWDNPPSWLDEAYEHFWSHIMNDPEEEYRSDPAYEVTAWEVDY